jgi:hypothetical protein
LEEKDQGAGDGMPNKKKQKIWGKNNSQKNGCESVP